MRLLASSSRLICVSNPLATEGRIFRLATTWLSASLVMNGASESPASRIFGLAATLLSTSSVIGGAWEWPASPQVKQCE